MKNILLLFTFLFCANYSFSQCTLTVDTPADTVDCGECFTLTADGVASPSLLSEDFNNGSFGAGWSSNVTVLYNNPCEDPPDGTPAAWFGNVDLPRTLETNDFDVSCGGEICFELDFAGDEGGDNCEDPDLTLEGVYLKYSIDGGNTWTQIFYFEPTSDKSGPYYSWANYCFDIPPAAETANTIFQWSQPEATAKINDHWGIDNVFINRISCDPYHYDWFVDGTPNSADTTLCYTDLFSSDTSETVDVIYTDGISDTCTASITMYLDPSLTADLGPDTMLNCDQTIELFSNESGGSGNYNIEWSTGDSNVGNVDNLWPDEYWVQVTDAANSNCVISDTIEVISPVLPIADFDFTSVCEKDGINFTDISTAGDGVLNQFQWDTDENGILDSTGTSVNTVYNEDGTYNVMHIIKDDNNCIDTVVKPVEIYPNPEVGFSFFPLCFGTATNFEDLTELPIGTNIGVWGWDFDDQGSTSSDQNPKHLFSEEGDFDVSLNVETEDGCTNDTTITIYIAPSPIADFNFADACINDEVSFTNETTGDFDNSQWILSNDSDTIFSTDIDNTFSTQGDYDVTLIVEDENYNCTDTITQTISIHPFPDLSFTADPMEGEPVLNVNFYTNTSGLSTNYWGFGNGNSSTSLNNTISNSFSDKGIFTVTHSGIDTNGCENSYSLEIVLDFGDVTYKIPNVLTPNDDGVNDGFYLTWFDARESITDFEIIILNRWGNLLKTYDDPDFIWNGENKSGNIVSDGTYFYKLQFFTIKGDEYNEHGFIHLVRD